MEQRQREKPDIMHQIAAAIVSGRFVLILLFLAAGVYCALSIGRVRVNSDLTFFLPAETETAEELRLCKFQAAGRILQRVLAYSRGNAAPHPQPVRWRERRMLGVYAPAGGSEATLFAAALGQILSGDQDVLYLNLHSCSGLELLSGEICERTLSDLLYYYHREEDSLMEKLSGAVRHLGVLEYIPPVSEPSDLQEISGEEWTSFLGRLLKDGPYDTLLLELSDSVHDLPELLGLCERIYLPVQRDAVAQAAAEQFFETLRSGGRADLRQRITVVRPPRPGSEEEVLLLKACLYPP